MLAGDVEGRTGLGKDRRGRDESIGARLVVITITSKDGAESPRPDIAVAIAKAGEVKHGLRRRSQGPFIPNATVHDRRHGCRYFINSPDEQRNRRHRSLTSARKLIMRVNTACLEVPLSSMLSRCVSGLETPLGPIAEIVLPVLTAEHKVRMVCTRFPRPPRFCSKSIG